MLASNPRSIIISTTGLDRMDKLKIDFENKAKHDIFLSDKRLYPSNLASFFIPYAAQKVGIVGATRFRKSPAKTCARQTSPSADTLLISK